MEGELERKVSKASGCALFIEQGRTHKEKYKGTTEPDEDVDGELLPPGKTDIFTIRTQEDPDQPVGRVEGEEIDEGKPSLPAAGNLDRLNLLIFGCILILVLGGCFDGHGPTTICS